MSKVTRYRKINKIFIFLFLQKRNNKRLIFMSFIFCTYLQISLGSSNQEEWGGRGMWHAWEKREKCTRFLWESPKERDHSEDRDVDGRMG
jgi:hypothetical protein